MKYIIILLIFITISCKDWLDVSPRQEMKQEDLFQTEEGFKNTLIGAYIMMAEKDLYGVNMSFYFTDYLSQTWLEGISEDENYILDKLIIKWDFKNSYVERFVDDLWKAYYKTIVQLNDILDCIDDAENLFKNGNYELIKGEALGLRAFLHLELLRLFGPIPDDDASSKSAIPYTETMTKNPNLLKTLSYKEVTDKIIRDLNLAEELLENDPIISCTNTDLNRSPNISWDGKPNDLWQLARQLRFNYYAVKGTKARFYHWVGDKTNAIKYAKEVIESNKFRLTNENDYLSSTDYTKSHVMLSEHLFGLHNPDLQSDIQSFFKSGECRLTQSESSIGTAYENNTADIRNVTNRYWERRVHELYTKNHFLKYSGTNSISSPNKIPLLRLSEIYLILIEDLPLGEKEIYFDDYILARNLPQSLKGTLTSDQAVKDRLEKEYRKEFMGEGQMFYFYKKHKYQIYSWPKTFFVPDDYINYEIPKPASQTDFD